MIESNRCSKSFLGRYGRLAAFALAIAVLQMAACQAPVRIVLPLPSDGEGDRVHLMGAVDASTRIPVGRSDLTLFELVSSAELAEDADLCRVHVIRPPGPDSADPLSTVVGENDRSANTDEPKVVRVDFRSMVMTGDMTYNLLLRPRDIVYIPQRAEPNPVIEHSASYH